jgi:hypothetical protein
MARLRRAGRALGRRVDFDLLVGPVDRPGEATVDELEAAWRLRGAEVLAGPQGRHNGKRPWAWWAFEIGEEPPRPAEAETIGSRSSTS